MSLPLYVAPTIFDQMNEVNAFSNAQLKNRMQELENKYYAPMADANINSLNANTNKTNTMLPLEATKMRQENELYIPLTKAEIANKNALTSKIPSEIRGQELQNQMYVTNALSNNAYQNSQTNKNNIMTPLEATRQAQENARYNELTDSKIAADKALSTWRATGGSGGSAGMKEERAYQDSVAKDNPNLNDNQIREAANVYAAGGDTLSDGTKLVPMTLNTQRAYDRAFKSTSTAATINAGIKANQADLELKVLKKHADAGLKPYGDTYLDKSPQQIADSFKSDKESQIKLGRFIASQALQYEINQLRIKLAGGQPGEGATAQLIEASKQNIMSSFPHLSARARQEASDEIDRALSEGLKTRNEYGAGASGAAGKKQSSSPAKATLRYNQETGSFEEIT